MKSLCVLFSFFLCSQLAFAASPKSDYFTTSDGVKIHFLEAGEGRAIVFIPGWTMPADIWQQQIDYFAPKYHVIAVDPRSQGDSDKAADGNFTERRAQDYKELVDHLKLDRPMLVGWSLAVSELLSYAEQFGADKIAGLVLVDGFIKLDPAMLSSFPVWLKGFQVNR